VLALQVKLSWVLLPTKRTKRAKLLVVILALLVGQVLDLALGRVIAAARAKRAKRAPCLARGEILAIVLPGVAPVVRVRELRRMRRWA